MGAKRYGSEYKGRFNTREQYEQHLEKMAQRYQMDEEFRQGQIERSKRNYHMTVSNPVLHERYLASRRDRMREYMRKRNAEKKGLVYVPAVSVDQSTGDVRSEIRKELRLLIE